MAHKDQEEKKDQKKISKKIKFQTPKIIKIVIWAIIVVIAIIIVIVVWPESKPEPYTAFKSIAPTPTVVAPTEEFVLKVGEIVQTVEAGQGTHHRIQSDKKFIDVAIHDDGSERKYEMPAGTSYWNGAAPWGRLLLEAKEAGTRVKIAPIN